MQPSRFRKIQLPGCRLRADGSSSLLLHLMLLAFSVTSSVHPASAQERSHSVELLQQGSWPTVEVRLGSRTAPYQFIVDTAAGATVVDQAIGDDVVRQSDGETSKVQGASGSPAPFQKGTLTKITFAGLTFRNTDVLITDMSRFGNDDHEHYDGILGHDILGKFSYIFDLPHHRLTLMESEGPDPRAWRCINNPLSNRPGGDNGFLSVPVTLLSRAGALGIVDTGAATTILNKPAASAKGITRDGKNVTASNGVRGFDATARTDSFAATLDGVGIVGTLVAPFHAKVSALEVFRGFGLEDTPGLILGANVWRDLPFAASRHAQAFCLAR